MLICSIGFMLMWSTKYNCFSAKLTILKTLNADSNLCNSAQDNTKFSLKRETELQ